MTDEKAFDVQTAVLEAVRGCSRQGRAATRQEVLDALAERGVAVSEAEVAQEAEAVLGVHPGIASFTSVSGDLLYHDPAVLSGTYARIVDRQGSPVVLLAEEIRSNSRDYPRPVPVELFEGPPFNLTPETIGDALRAMAAEAAYGDITFTTTASGAVYLFSSRYLARGYAGFLAECTEDINTNP